jgi:hypothetical protein
MGTGSQERFFSQADFCLVRLGQKVTGRYLLCGHSILDCTRGLATSSYYEPRTTDADKKVFTILRLTNASNKGFDAIEDTTLVTLEDKTAEQNRHHALLWQP